MGSDERPVSFKDFPLILVQICARIHLYVNAKVVAADAVSLMTTSSIGV